MVQLEANYSKKLGLPGFSSHAFSVTIKSELADLSKVPEESSRLYTLLQRSVDKELQQTGFLPIPRPASDGSLWIPGKGPNREISEMRLTRRRGGKFSCWEAPVCSTAIVRNSPHERSENGRKWTRARQHLG